MIADNEITNRHTDICVPIDRYPGAPAPRGVVIERNRIHDCGELPALNHDHGIYVDTARDTVIRENLIYDNADRGIQLYPDATGTRIVGNVIDGNGEGVIFGNRSDGTLVKDNIISNSTIRHNIESSGSTATDNQVRGNCLWSARRLLRRRPSAQRGPAQARRLPPRRERDRGPAVSQPNQLPAQPALALRGHGTGEAPAAGGGAHASIRKPLRIVSWTVHTVFVPGSSEQTSPGPTSTVPPSHSIVARPSITTKVSAASMSRKRPGVQRQTPVSPPAGVAAST